MVPYVVDGDNREEAVWAPQPGSQCAALECPIYEMLYEGERGPGKTDLIIMDFGQEVGKGWGVDWSGIIFRRTYPELEDVINKTKKWFPRIWPKAKYNESAHMWRWPSGESLYLRHAMRDQDYWSYHGHSYPFIAWEELCTWANSGLYTRLMSICRSTRPGIPIKYRATANPYGPGHNWVKARFRLPVSAGRICGQVITDSRDVQGEIEEPRVAIHGSLSENKVLLHADPGYVRRLASAARNPAELKAWLHGDWNIVAGGMFDDKWDTRVHSVPDVPPHLIPQGWHMDRSFDWGQSKPFSVGWWAESNGEPFTHDGFTYGEVRGDIYRIAEWYGWNGRPNEGVRMLASKIAEGIIDREEDWGIKGRVKPGGADPSIYTDVEPKKSVAGDMKKENGGKSMWYPADNKAGSRKQGWEQMRKYLSGAKPDMTGVREEPGLFIMRRCQRFLDTVPCLSRSDKDPDDINTDDEDHIADETRYRLRAKKRRVRQGKM